MKWSTFRSKTIYAALVRRMHTLWMAAGFFSEGRAERRTGHYIF